MKYALEDENLFWIKFATDDGRYIHAKLTNGDPVKCHYVTEGHDLNDAFQRDAETRQVEAQNQSQKLENLEKVRDSYFSAHRYEVVALLELFFELDLYYNVNQESFLATIKHAKAFNYLVKSQETCIEKHQHNPEFFKNVQ